MKSKKYTFNSNYSSLGFLSHYSQEEIRLEPMLRGCDIHYAFDHGGPITKEFIVKFLDPEENWIIDSKTVMLMRGWYPCIPGWHHDDVERTRADKQPNYDVIKHKTEHIMSICGDTSLTEFLLGDIELEKVALNKKVYAVWSEIIDRRIKKSKAIKVEKIKNYEVVKFDYQAFHRGCISKHRAWRFFIRATKNSSRKFNNEIRHQVQVYMPAINDGW